MISNERLQDLRKTAEVMKGVNKGKMVLDADEVIDLVRMAETAYDNPNLTPEGIVTRLDKWCEGD